MFPIQFALRKRKSLTRYDMYRTSEGYALHVHKWALYVYLTNQRLLPKTFNYFA